MEKLNDEQRKLIEDNYSLISFFYKTYFSRFEDYYEYKSLAHIAICKAALKYKEGRGEFSTFFYHVLKTEIGHYDTMNGYDVRKANMEALSINSSPSNCDDDSLQFINLIPARDNVEDSAVEKVYWQSKIEKQTDRRQQVIRMRYEGYLQKEIGEKLGMTWQGVSDHLMKFKKSMGY